MKDWKKATIAFAPILFAIWLVIGWLDNFITATICIVLSLAITAIVTAWIYFVFHILDD